MKTLDCRLFGSLFILSCQTTSELLYLPNICFASNSEICIYATRVTDCNAVVSPWRHLPSAKKKNREKEWWHFKWSRTPTRRTRIVSIRYWWAGRVCIKCGHGIAHIANRFDAISSIKLIWSANGCCVGTSRATSFAYNDHNERSQRRCASICIHCTRLCQIHFTDERQRQRYLWRSVFGTVRRHCRLKTPGICRAERRKKEKTARRATDRLTSCASRRTNVRAINNLQLSCHSAHRNFIFRLAVRTLAKRRRQEMDFIRSSFFFFFWLLLLYRYV